MGDKANDNDQKKKMIAENEKQYGAEIREKFGDDVIDAGNARLMGLTEAQFKRVETLSKEVNEHLKKAFEEGDPSGAAAQQSCALHREWLSYFWNFYSKEAHLALAQSYVDDPRFRKYYDAIAPGCAEFLFEAMKIFCRP